MPAGSEQVGVVGLCDRSLDVFVVGDDVGELLVNEFETGAHWLDVWNLEEVGETLSGLGVAVGIDEVVFVGEL